MCIANQQWGGLFDDSSCLVEFKYFCHLLLTRKVNLVINSFMLAYNVSKKYMNITFCKNRDQMQFHVLSLHLIFS